MYQFFSVLLNNNGKTERIPNSLDTYLARLVLSAGLIIVIGAQNAHVLRQGVSVIMYGIAISVVVGEIK